MKSFAGSALVLLAVSALMPSSYGQATGTPAADSGAAVRAGGLDFVLPSPDKSLVEAGSDYRVVFEPLSPNSNRLIAAFLPPDKLRSLTAGQGVPSLDHYALVEVPRRAEFANVNAELFEQFVATLGKQLAGDLSGSVQYQKEELNRRLKELGSTNSVNFQQPIPLGTFFSKTDESGFGIILPVSTQQRSARMAAAIGVVRIKNRVICTYLYSVYKDESTIAELKAADEHWADAIVRENQ